jgi:hypothetical protein
MDSPPLLAVQTWELDGHLVEVWVTGYAWWERDELQTRVVAITDEKGECLKGLLRHLGWCSITRSHAGWDAWAHDALTDAHEKLQAMQDRLRREEWPGDLLPFVAGVAS